MKMSKYDAAKMWASGFKSYPTALLSKLIDLGDDVTEVTPLFVGEEVLVDGTDAVAVITSIASDVDSGDVVISYDDGTHGSCTASCTASECDIEHFFDDALPMWGTMWAFDNEVDRRRLEDADGHLNVEFARKMAGIGFRIFFQKEMGFVFGIDAAGFDFVPAYWEPLYDLCGMQWHEKDK